MDILTNFYIEAYKKGMYEKIAIGHDSDGYNYYLTTKQINALKLLKDNTTLFVGYGGSARCLVSGTFVQTVNGKVKIEDIKIGDIVLSFDGEKLLFNKVLEKFEYYIDKEIVQTNKISITKDHKIFFNGEWTEIGELREIALSTKHQLSHNTKSYVLNDFIAREITFDELEESEIIHYTGYVYDLEVENTHSYCVSEDNIIVHNSGKTLLECFWITFECLASPGVAYGLARRELTVLKKTVLRTLFQVFTFYKLKDGEDYKYHEQKNIITFKNGSEIFLIDMAYQPSDPLYTRFGGLELTGAAVDESNESDYDAIGTLFTRCGWKKNTEYGIKKKMLETFNPDHGHVYKRYYAPFRDKLETESRKFIPALPGDNPHPATKEWIEDVIKENDKVRIQRLIYGNFDYSEDESMLVDWDAINDAFANENIQKDRINKYISADIALQGRDKFVCALWYGKYCEIVIDKAKATAPEVEQDIKRLMKSHNIYNSNIVGDSDGLGGFLAGYIRNIKAFRGNRKAINHKDYDNIKSECAWKLADLINKREIKIVCTPKQEELIKQELSVCLRRDNVDIDDQKKKLIKKPQMKRELGRSPDYFDAIMMGMVFFLTRSGNMKIKVIKE